MNTRIKAIIYLMGRLKKSLPIMFGIFLGIILLIRIVGLITSGPDTKISYGSIDFVFAVYIFVYFTASYRESFNHLSMCGVSRKAFFIAYSTCLLATSFIVLVATYIFKWFLEVIGIQSNLVISYAYMNSNFIQQTLILFCIYITAGIFGWLCSLLTYKFGKFTILAIIFVPQVLFTLIGLILTRTNSIDIALRLLTMYFALAEGMSSYIVCVNLLITTAVLGIINWIAMRRLAVRV